MAITMRAARDLTEGDMVDLEPAYSAFAPNTEDDWFVYDLAIVIGVEAETDTCVRIDHESGAFGVPADYLIPVHDDIDDENVA